jgi:probable F420-dependent oxidoreductase
MQLGITLPTIDIGGDPVAVKTMAQTAEGIGYDYIAVADHVLGVNAASRPDWGARNTSADCFHDPFVLFGYLASCTERIGFSTEVMIIAQRQAALMAKQAASLDVLSGGRFRFGVGVGWNPVEYVGLDMDFTNRGKRSAEQVAVMQALWADAHVSFKGQWHEIDDAGINPLPLERRVPVWFGGHADVTLQRIAQYGDGWIMLSHPAGDEAERAFDTLRGYWSKAGRKGEPGLSVWVSNAEGGPEDWRKAIAYWKSVGVSHVTVNNSFGRYHHKRIEGRSLADHLRAMVHYRDVVADLL